MNAHAQIAEQAALLPTEPDTYALPGGTCITHVDQPMPSLVMCRMKAGNGWEIYGVLSFAYEDPQRERLILGTSLVVPRKADCKECLLATSGMCVRPELK